MLGNPEKMRASEGGSANNTLVLAVVLCVVSALAKAEEIGRIVFCFFSDFSFSHSPDRRRSFLSFKRTYGRAAVGDDVSLKSFPAQSREKETVEDGCGSKSTDTDLTGFYFYIFASMLASSEEE
jgi:hypothetical protein